MPIMRTTSWADRRTYIVLRINVEGLAGVIGITDLGVQGHRRRCRGVARSAYEIRVSSAVRAGFSLDRPVCLANRSWTVSVQLEC